MRTVIAGHRILILNSFKIIVLPNTQQYITMTSNDMLSENCTFLVHCEFNSFGDVQILGEHRRTVV